MSDLDALRTAHGDLSRKLFRVALTSLVLLFLVVFSFARAFARVNGDEVATRLATIAAITKRTGITPVVPTIFEPAWNSLDVNVALVDLTDQERRQAQKEIDDSVAALSALADAWFTLKLPLVFAQLEIDLRDWIVTLPLLLWISNSYLWIIRTKLKIVEQLAAREVAKPENTLVLDRLAFAERAAWTRLPATIGTAIYLCGTVGLLLFLANVALPLWKLFDDPEPRTGRGIVVWVLLLVTYYVVAWTLYVEARLRSDANAIMGIDAPTLAQRFVRFIDRALTRAAELLARCGRWLATPAAGAVLVSLFTAFAHNCDGDAMKGHTLLHDTKAMWFSASIIPESLVPWLGRVYYAVTLLLAVVALVFGRRLNTFARRCLAAAALFLYVELVFVYPALYGWVVGDAIRIVFLGIPLFFLLRRGRNAVRPFLITLYLPGLVVAPLACLWLVQGKLWGVPIYFAGFELLAVVVTTTVLAEGLSLRPIAPLVAHETVRAVPAS